MRRTLLLVGMIAATATAGCSSSVVNGAGRGSTAALPLPTSSVPSIAAPSSPSFPSPSAAPTVLVPSTPIPSVPTTTAAAPSQADITDLHYRVPTGFVKVTNYEQVHPLTSHYVAAYVVPKNERNGRDVLSIVLYRLAQKQPVGSVAAQKARVRLYNQIAHARRLSAITETTVGGRLALQESLFEQPDYRYVTWFVIATGHVLQVNCQVSQQVNKIASACGKWVQSVRIG